MRCGLLGKTLVYSHSPTLHRLLGDYDYTLFETQPEAVADFLQSGAWDGLNVTIPYKKTAYAFCDALSPTAKATGSVNTLLRRRDGSIFGDNTDYFGFKYLLEKNGVFAAGKRALVLGSGGASATVCAVLRDMGARVTFVSRNAEIAHTEGGNIQQLIGADRTTYDRLSAYKDAQIIVNATPVGTYPENGRSPIDLEKFPNLEFVGELIYNPTRTALLLQAEALGIPHGGGLSMLAAQAAASASLFLGGTAIEPDKIRQAEDELRRQTENIVLIGMPASGKSTLGAMLGKALGRPVWDSDEELLQRTGLTAEELLTRRGEGEFRRLETEVLSDLGKRWGGIIATGGGCVTRSENRDLLRQNGRIIWLQRGLAKLDASGRPLLKTASLEELYRQRKALYEGFCDKIISNDGTPQETLQRLKESLL